MRTATCSTSSPARSSRQVGDLRKMVDEFSSFARLHKPVFRDEDALDLVRQSVFFLQEVAHSGIAFSVSSSDLLDREIRCDRHQFGQAMTNVLKNAVEAVEARASEARGGICRTNCGCDKRTQARQSWSWSRTTESVFRPIGSA